MYDLPLHCKDEENNPVAAEYGPEDRISSTEKKVITKAFVEYGHILAMRMRCPLSSVGGRAGAPQEVVLQVDEPRRQAGCSEKKAAPWLQINEPQRRPGRGFDCTWASARRG